MDTRYEKLAEVLVGYSLELKKSERVQVDAFDVPEGMVIEIVRAIHRRGAFPHVGIKCNRVMRELYKISDEGYLKGAADIDLYQMKKMDAYIGLRGAGNIFELSDVGAEKMKLVMAKFKPVQDYRISHTRWVVLRWPTSSMAQQSMMSTEGFEDFFFKVCTFDYSRFSKPMRVLKALMESTDKVRIKGPGTDLHFSIKGIPAIISEGKRNIPDGEVFTAPVLESIEGNITYNVPSIYLGTPFENLRFVFKKGKIVEASANNEKKLKEILDSDKGARYIGEFAIGVNPHILHPMRDILFDEKIAGSFHFTPGQSYEIADNGNRSQVHWDLVCIQRPEYGGGEIYFDEQLVRKDGLFVLDELKGLNPEALLKA